MKRPLAAVVSGYAAGAECLYYKHGQICVIPLQILVWALVL
jgi:hypothetical protein